MKIGVSMSQHFGPSLSNGELAAAFVAAEITPFLVGDQTLSLDFSGIRSANSSFINALFSEIVTRHGGQVLERIEFKGCRSSLAVLIESAIQLGLKRASQGSVSARVAV